MKSKTKQGLIEEIENALESVSWGSIELHVQDNKVTQITVRNITKTSIDINSDEEGEKENKFLTISARFRRTD